MKKRRAFTLVEVVIALAIMSIMAGVMALNSAAVGQHTAKKEAERVAAFIQGHISRANIAMRGVWFEVKTDSIEVRHGFEYSTSIPQNPPFNANSGCSYTASQAKLCYNIKKSKIQTGWEIISDDSTVITDSGTNGQHCITIEGADKKYSNVIIGRK